MKVFDNIISKKEQKFIKNNLLDNADFPWSYVSDVSKKGNTYQRRPGFKHIFKNYNLIKPILNNIKAKLKYVKDEVLEARSFLQLPLDKNFIGKGVDTPHLDRTEPHLVVLYYVNDSDGDTIIYDYKSKDENDIPYFEDIKELKRIKPKQGRVVVFDGLHWHTAEQPRNDIRCIININLNET